MNSIRLKTKKKLAALLAMSLLLGPLTGVNAAETSEPSDAETEAQVEELTSGDTVEPGDVSDEGESHVIDPSLVYSEELLQYIPEVEDHDAYLDYLDEHSQVPAATEAIELDLSSVTEGETEEETDQPVFELDGEELHTFSGGRIDIPFSVSDTAMYELEVEYLPLEGTGTAIERRIEIDGEVPFDEASVVLFRRIYQDANRDYKDIEENQYFPSQVEAPRWTTVRVSDMNGYFIDPLQFMLEEGDHTLSLFATKEPMAIRSLRFVPTETLPDYNEYIDARRAAGAEEINTVVQSIHIQGEDALYKSSPSLYPLNDRTSPATEPYHPTYIRMNTIGGQSWNQPGDWLEWEFEAPQSGLYRLAFRFKQDLNTGSFSTRELRVNGEVPFEEARHLQFYYDSSWQVSELTDDEGNAQLVYLEEGLNTLSLTASLDEFAQLIYDVEGIAVQLNGIAQDIVVITSTSPDQFRDYQLDRRLPHMLPTMEEQLANLRSVVTRLTETMGGSSDKTAALDKTALQLQAMLDDPNTIAQNLTSLQGNITALGNWALTIRSQSLEIDFMSILGEEDPLPRARANFLENIWHEIQAFIGSFTNNLDARVAGADSETAEEITVWVTTGRDQMDVINRLLMDTFDANIQVNLRLVASSVALSATAAGTAPDVIIQTDSAQPIDFAFRGAAYDLTQFEDFDEISQWVHPGALGAFEFEGGYYAIPDQMSFPVLFYRADILSELQIPIPQTWQDIITIIPFLQTNNMEFFMEVSPPPTLGAATQSTTKAINSIFLSMLYQQGGELYNEQGSRALTDSPESLTVFENWTDYYTKNSFPVTVDFVTRFRLGSVPLAIVNFTNYTTLSVSAPEIRGDWGISQIPGTRLEDGTIDRALPATTSAAMIIKPSVEENGNAQEAWEFIKWWVSADTQTNYAAEMESLLGSSARYPVANLDAFQLSPWPTQAMNVLTASLDDLREIRQVPGSYITGRNIENAFYEVVNQPEQANPRRSMIEWTVNTNYELTSKREEFGLETYQGEE